MHFGGSGVEIIHPVNVKIPLLADPDALRDRIGLLTLAHDFMRIKHPHCGAWSTSSERTWDEHLKYVLGDEVRLQQMTKLQGQVIKTLDWQLVLHYEQGIRDTAAELNNEGKFGVETPYDPAKALREARMDP